MPPTSQPKMKQARKMKAKANAEAKTPGAWRRWALAAVLVAAVIGVVLRFGEVKYFADILRHARPLWLLAAAGLQSLTYLFVAVGWWIVLRAAGSKTSMRKRIATLTPSAAQLVRYTRKHPVPSSFWSGEDDPSKPAKR